MEKISPTMSAGELVADDDRVAPVLLKHGIDFCCHGDQTIEQACQELGLSTDKVIQDLRETQAHPSSGHTYRLWSLEFLIDFIENEHHAYAREKLLEIEALAETVADVHGDEHPEMREIAAIWAELEADLEDHLEEEEAEIFPTIKALSDEQTLVDSDLEDPRGWLESLRDDHEETADRLHRLESVSDGFEPPVDSCSATDLLYRRLAEFDEQTKRHVHLENHVLFPRALGQTE